MNTTSVLLLCLFNLFSFVIGALIGQRSTKGKEIIINPIKAIKEDIRENKNNKQELLRKKQIETMLENIEKYDGSGIGQKQIPKD